MVHNVYNLTRDTMQDILARHGRIDERLMHEDELMSSGEKENENRLRDIFDSFSIEFGA